MTAGAPGLKLGRHVFGLAALGFGVITLAWHDYQDAYHLRYLVLAASVALIPGGAAIQFRKTAKTGAAVLAAAYLVFALLCVPGIIAAPRIYNSWATSSSSSRSLPERPSLVPAAHSHGHPKQ